MNPFRGRIILVNKNVSIVGKLLEVENGFCHQRKMMEAILAFMIRCDDFIHHKYKCDKMY